MVWRVEFSERSKKSLKRLDRPVATRIYQFLEGRVAATHDPRDIGKALVGEHSGYWRYRVGDYRIICELRDDVLVVLVIEIGHRRHVYQPN